VRWVDDSTNETGFEVLCRLRVDQLPSGGSVLTQPVVTLPVYTHWADVAHSESNTASTTASILVPNFKVTIEVKVRARFSATASADSATARVASDLTFPVGHAFPAPSALAGTAQSISSARFTWSDNYRNEPESVRYVIERSPHGTNQFTTAGFQGLLLANRNEAEVVGIDHSASETYLVDFRIRSVPTGTDAETGRYQPSAPSNVATVDFTNFALTPPSNVAASASSSSAITVTWTDTTTTETYFIVSQATSANGPFQALTPFALTNETSYFVNGLSAGTQYFFKVQARNAQQTSRFSGTASASTLSTQSAPAAPSELTAMAYDPHGIELRWRDNSSNETDFAIERRVGMSGPFDPFGTYLSASFGRDPSDSNYIICTDEGADVLSSTTYCYRVRAQNSIGSSQSSASACATTLATTATAVRFTNSTAYPLVSLTVNGVEQLPGPQTGVLAGSTIQVGVTAGSYTFIARNGFLDANGNKVEMYRFPVTGNGSGTVASGQTSNQNVVNYSLPTILTRRTGAARTYFAEDNFGTQYTCTIFTSGAYHYSINGEQIDAGSVQLDAYNGDGVISFRLVSSTYNSAALFVERPDEQGRCKIFLAGLVFGD
jgi:hypothetical protein